MEVFCRLYALHFACSFCLGLSISECLPHTVSLVSEQCEHMQVCPVALALRGAMQRITLICLTAFITLVGSSLSL